MGFLLCIYIVFSLIEIYCVRRIRHSKFKIIDESFTFLSLVSVEGQDPFKLLQNL